MAQKKSPKGRKVCRTIHCTHSQVTTVCVAVAKPNIFNDSDAAGHLTSSIMRAGSVFSVACSPNAALVASGGADDTIWLWQACAVPCP